MKNIISLWFGFLFLSSVVIAQTDTNKVTDTTSNVEKQGFVMQKSAWGAVTRSAILPGWGQAYNQSYYKIPVVWGLLGWLGYNWVYNNNKYHDNANLVLNPPQGYSTTQLKTVRDFYHDQRDLFAIYIVLTYLANLVDAYVDAHLFDFNVQEDFYRGTVMQMRLKF